MITDTINRLCCIAADPRASMNAYIASGRKIAGCIPEYSPETLIHAAGIVPFGMWGGETTIMHADKYMPTFACSIMRSCVELALSGKYDGISFAVVPVTCDALKGCSQTLRTAVHTFPTLAFALPQNRSLASAKKFASGEIAALRDKISDLVGAPITDEALAESIEVYNAHNEVMREFARIAAVHTDVISASVREAVFKSAWFMEKSEHTEEVKKLNAELEKMPECRKKSLRVFLSGVTAGSMEFMKILEEEGFDVVGDWVYQDSWLYFFDIPDGETPVDRLAAHWMSVGACCFAHETKRTRADRILELAHKAEADALIMCVMKFCDPEEYEMPQLLAELRNEYPVTVIDIDQNGDNAEQLRTRIQSFRELLE